MRARLALFVVLAGLFGTASAHAAAPPRLSVQRGADAIIRTDDGRQALMRGINVDQLGDYFAVRPDLPTVVPLRKRDFRQIAALGLDHVRLIVSWSALEPRRGAFDAAYVKRIRQAVGWARDSGLHVVLDMHQDAWGKHIASGKESCLPGFGPAQGWDGAPAWATITDGLPRCRIVQRELSPAVAQAWMNFLTDRDGIRTALAKTWGRLARVFAADPTVAGYDLLNEPNPGFLVGAAGPTFLAAFYADAIREIRAAERSVRGGFAHIAYFEPTVIWSAAGVDAAPLPGFTPDSNIVFAPHLYGESITLDRSTGFSLITVEAGFQLAQTIASLYGTPIWSGEWGWFGNEAGDGGPLRRYAAAEDRARIGGAWWSWRQACGDPHQFSLPSTDPFSVSPSLNRYACPSGTPIGIPKWIRSVLSRPRPLYAPGQLTALSSDPASGAMMLGGRDPDASGSCVLDVWAPGAAKPTATGAGVTRIRRTRVKGGWRVTGCATGAYSFAVRAGA